MSEKVYFIDDRSTWRMHTSLPAKAQWLFEKAGLANCFEEGDSVATKVHMGEWFNTGYLRPILVRAIVDKVKEYGGNPFVADTTTALEAAFWGRTTASDYLFTAAANGFTPSSMDCPIIIADGNIGLDDVRVEVPNGLILKEAYIARAIADVDALIVISHFKGHDTGVFGGAIKNVGVGCSSKRGKMCLHVTTHPKYGIPQWPYSPEACIGRKECSEAEVCVSLCPVFSYKITNDGIEWDKDKCIGCMSCVNVRSLCGVIAIPDEWHLASIMGFVDAASACIKTVGKESTGFINYAIDISPLCDCAPATDRSIMPNIGVFVSKDPVAVDLACLDKSMKLVGIPGSLAEKSGVLEPGTEKFTFASSAVNISQWTQINAAEQLRLGNKDYELVEIEPGPPEKFYFPLLKYPNITSGYHFRKYFEHKRPLPPGGFKYLQDMRIPIEELSKR